VVNGAGLTNAMKMKDTKVASLVSTGVAAFLLFLARFCRL
jgi:hypothetical protein